MLVLVIHTTESKRLDYWGVSTSTVGTTRLGLTFIHAFIHSYYIIKNSVVVTSLTIVV